MAANLKVKAISLVKYGLNVIANALLNPPKTNQNQCV